MQYSLSLSFVAVLMLLKPHSPVQGIWGYQRYTLKPGIDFHIHGTLVW